MMDPFPEEHELLWLFACEPELTDADLPWCYNSLRFKRTIGNDVIECEIVPALEELDLRWRQRGVEVMHLDLCRVSGLQVRVERGHDTLIATFPEKTHLYPLEVRLTPSVFVSWGVDPSPL
jgi:hypothetical protein